MPRGSAAQGRKFIAYLYDTAGRRFVLPSLDDRLLADLLAEVAELREVAGQHRGAPFEPLPDVEALVRKRAAHRKAWERAAAGTLVTLMCTFLTWLVRAFTSAAVPPVQMYFVYAPLTTFVLLAALFHWRASRP
ncbi:hypothetical protein [Streptomyces sp. NPDC058867]|uniref:hypothetical protein n=1 Tax=unclassified Streptomyces TaxID=2593676 RepID=UPI0036A91A32